MNTVARVAFTVICLAALAGSASGAEEFWPGVEYDAAVPTFEEVLGHAPGDEIVPPSEILVYMHALAKAAPDRMRLYEYARSWENRKLIYAVIGSKENIVRLDDIKQGYGQLADPRDVSEDRAGELIASLPASVWLSYGVHGNEISSSDAALFTAYHLLAAKADPVVESILTNAVVFIDPSQNPDGRSRFVHHFETTRGLEPDASPLAVEHNEPWPGGRTNHYLFDMNRDWFALTQPESVGRVKALLEWYPLIFVDLHEMGGNSTYYFPPEAVPYNPHFGPYLRDNLDILGKNNAKWFDHFGFSYFTREIYDAFYPGYGSSWPVLYGGLGTTYEEASSRGLVFRRTDGTNLTFRETVHHHFVASISTAEMAAVNREKLLQDFYDFQITAIEEGKSGPVREYILPYRGDTSLVDKLAGLLAMQGVDVKRATASFRSCGNEYPAGSYVVPMAQPMKRFIEDMLAEDVSLKEDFIKEQERRRAKKLPDEIYDVTSWSLPLMYNIECIPCNREARGDFEEADSELIRPGAIAGDGGEVAYLVPWGTTAAGRFLTAALREDLHVWSTDKAFTQNGTQYPTGTLILKTKENAGGLRAAIAQIAKETGATVHPTNTGWVDSGVNFGSNHVVKMHPPRIALAWDTPTSAYSAGQTRFILERQYNYPVTVIRTRQLAMADLSRFQVLILPSGGGYASVLREAGNRRLKEWVTAGGVLVALGGAVSYVADPEIDLLAIREEYLAKAKDEKEKNGDEKKEKKVPGVLLESEEAYLKSIRAAKETPDNVQGVFVKAVPDSDHWLAAGLAKSLNVLVRGRSIYTPITLDKGVNAVRFAAEEDLLTSGYIWDENKRQLAFKPFLVQQSHGRGMVIGFTQDPTVRAYLDGLNVALLNAVFRGTAHATPVARN